MLNKVVICCLLVTLASAVPLPKYLKACKGSDPNFNKCVVTHGNDAIPHLLEGDKTLHIPFMKPIRIPFAQVAQPNFNLNLTDIDGYGLDTVTLTDAKVDVAGQKAQIFIHATRITLKSTYNIHGKILVLPIEGSGPCELNFDDCTFQYNFDWKLNTRKNVKYAKIVNDDLSFVIGKGSLQFDNLFNGDSKLAGEMNKFLNENFQEVLKDFGPTIGKTVAGIARTIANGVFDKTPYEELILV